MNMQMYKVTINAFSHVSQRAQDTLVRVQLVYYQCDRFMFTFDFLQVSAAGSEFYTSQSLK